MTVYRFKVSFEDYDVSREVEIRSNQTFEDLHKAIHLSLNYSPEVPSSFYISNDQWIKGTEITIFPNDKRKEKGVSLMSDSRLNNFIEDPHQKFYYTSNFERPFDFHVELIRILSPTENGEVLPKILKSSGEPPKQFVQLVKPIEKSSSSGKSKKPLAEILPEQDLISLDDEEEDTEEEPENAFAIENIEDIEEEDHKGLGFSHKLAGDEEGEMIDSTESESDDDLDEFGEFGAMDHEEENPHKDDY
jgi:hypothetical protein